MVLLFISFVYINEEFSLRTIDFRVNEIGSKITIIITFYIIRRDC